MMRDFRIFQGKQGSLLLPKLIRYIHRGFHTLFQISVLSLLLSKKANSFKEPFFSSFYTDFLPLDNLSTIYAHSWPNFILSDLKQIFSDKILMIGSILVFSLFCLKFDFETTYPEFTFASNILTWLP